jgi:HAMP domain-containing protein
MGTRLNSREVLYYFFPLTQQESTITAVQRTLIGVSIGLVMLIVLIAWLVTRQVVIPVRLAAQAAERLASGRLEERMKARGEDDFARLANSFNGMAGNLQEKIKALEDLSQVQRLFVSDVSHELRTPLTTIRIAADLIYEERGEFEPAVSRSAELLQNQLERFESLLADLLEISRHDAGAATLDAESVDVRDLVLKAVGETEDLAERKGSKLLMQLPGEPCMAEVDHRRVARGQGHRGDRGRRQGRGRRGSTRPWRRPQAGRGADGLRPVLARRPGEGAYHRRHRARALDLPGGRAAPRRLAPGVGRAGRRLAVQAVAAARGGGRAAGVAAAAGTDGRRAVEVAVHRALPRA